MQFPQTLVKKSDGKEERVAFHVKHYEVSVIERGRVMNDVIRYDYNNSNRQELIKSYLSMGFIFVEELV